MVVVIKRRKGKKTYYYLKHTSTDRQRETYLGSTVPENIAELKERFMFEFYRKEWNSKLEAISKNYRAEVKRTPKSVLAENLDGFGIRFTYNTQRIEGSTMTFRETAALLLHGVAPLNRPEHERHEATVHKEIFREMLKRRRVLTLNTILGWHERMFSLTDHADAGSIRKYPVGISGSRAEFPLWEDVPEMLEAFMVWYNENRGVLNPAELAATAHYRFVSIHPFGDGNGRISRLIMNHILHGGGYPMFIVMTADKETYVRSLEHSNLDANAIFFVRWFMKRYIRSNRKYLDGPK